MATAEANIQNKIRKGKKISKDENLEGYVEILDENADAKSENIKAEQIKLSSEDDLESLLKLAEDLKEKIDSFDVEIKSYRHRVIISYLILALVFLVTPFTAYAAYSQLINNSSQLTDSFYNFLIYSWKFFFIALICLILCNLIWNFIGNTKISDLEKRIRSDKFALKEVLQLLREVHGTIAEREDWSILKRAEFRIRLSRFDLSEKKESVFSFFS